MEYIKCIESNFFVHEGIQKHQSYVPGPKSGSWGHFRTGTHGLWMSLSQLPRITLPPYRMVRLGGRHKKKRCADSNLPPSSAPPYQSQLGRGQKWVKIRSEWIVKCSHKAFIRTSCQVQGCLIKFEPISSDFEPRGQPFLTFCSGLQSPVPPSPSQPAGTQSPVPAEEPRDLGARSSVARPPGTVCVWLGRHDQIQRRASRFHGFG